MSRKLGAILSFFLPLGVYVRTLSPSVNFGDTGELITASATLGIPHPPGFPLWVILSHFFTYLPFNSIAWRVNLSSAVFASLSILTLYLLINLVLSRLMENERLVVIISLAVSLSLSFTSELWSQAIITEVYALYFLMAISVVYFLYRYSIEESPRWLYLAFMFLGLGITNHYLAVLLLPPTLFYLIIYHPTLFTKTPKVLIKAITLFLLSLCVFLYLPIRSSHNPVIDWGNPENMGNFLSVVMRKQFSFADQVDLGVVTLPFSFLAKPATQLMNTLELIVIITFKNLGPVILLLAFLGLYTTYRKDRRLMVISLLFWGALGPGFAFLIGDSYRVGTLYIPYVPSFFILAVIASIGFGESVQVIRTKPNLWKLVVVLLILMPAIFLAANFKSRDYSTNTVAYDHALNLLNTAEKNAIIFSEENEWLFPLLYVHSVEGVRPDITLYDRNGNLFNDIYKEAKKDYRSEQYYESKRKALEEELFQTTARPAYYAVDKNFENYHYADVYKVGVLYRLKEAQPLNFGESYQNILNRTLTFVDDMGTNYIMAYYHIQYGDEFRVVNNYDQAKVEYEKAYQFGKLDTRILNNLSILFSFLGDKARAEEILHQSISLSFANQVAHNNLGSLLEDKRDDEGAEKAYLNALQVNPKYLPAILNLARFKEKKGLWESALNYYRQAYLLNPADAKIEAKVREMELLQQKGAGGEITYQQALDLAKGGKCREALPVFEALYDQEPNNVEVLNNIGVCAAYLADYQKAREAWEKVLEILPEHENATYNLNLLESM